MIHSNNLQDHHKQVKVVLEKLLAAGLFVKPEKCEFEANRTTFLGFVISQQGIEMDPEKVSAVLNWEVPKTIQDVQCFLAFANFYMRFIEGHSRICTPLFNLLKTVDKDKETSTVTTKPDRPAKKVTNKAPIQWTPCCQQVFDELKSRFCSAPILKHFDPTLETVLETDASDYVVSGILSQRHPDPTKPESHGTLHPVASLSEIMSPAECNYGIGDKELLAILACLNKWHMYLHGVQFLIYTDHHNLQNFGTKALLNRRQARWAGLLAQYEFQIQFRPGKANGKADALTRRSGDLPKEGDMRGRPFQEILDPVKFSTFPNPVLCNAAIKDNADIRSALAEDELAIEIAQALDNRDKQLTGKYSRSAPLGECIVENGLLYIYGLLYVPDNETLYREILHAHHDHPAAGHPGRAPTYELVSRNYWWPGMRKTIARYLANCDTCARIKPVRHAPYGLLKPMQVSVTRWGSVSMDFITGLPKSGPQQHDAILVIVDRLIKMAHYIRTHESVTSEGTARVYFDNIFRLHGLPDSLVSDRGTQFTSGSSRALCKLVGITQNLSTSFQPQTDGQTERVNAILEQYLRGYINYQQDNWTEILTMAEFAYNNTVSATTGITPFLALYGQHPRWIIKQNPTTKAPTPAVLEEWANQLENLNTSLKSDMVYAQAIQAEQADKDRLPAPAYKFGDEVWLLRRHIQTTSPSSKLDFKRLGRFKITQKISSHAYKLDLPASMKCHTVFHVSLLEPAASNPLAGQKQPAPPPIICDDNVEFEVEEILDSKFVRKTLKYLVRWVGYDELTSEPAELL